MKSGNFENREVSTGKGFFGRPHKTIAFLFLCSVALFVPLVLDVSGHTQLMDGDPSIQRSIILRNPYIDPLNYIQVEMLRRLRSLPDTEGSEAEALREVIVLTINGIASGLRNTG